VVLTRKDMEENHKHFFDQLKIPVPDALMPFVGFRKDKGFTVSANAMNLLQKPFLQIVQKSNVHIKVLEWMTE
jgi:hypothetical protein